MYSLQPRIRTEFCFFRVSDKQSLTVTKSQGKKINLSRLYDGIKFFAKAQLAFLFKWSFLLPKWNSLIPLLPIKLIPFLHEKIVQTGIRICYDFLNVCLVFAVTDG